MTITCPFKDTSGLPFLLSPPKQRARRWSVWVTCSASLLRLCWAVIPFPAAHAPLTCSPPEFLSSDRTHRRLLLLFKRQPGTMNISLRSCFLARGWSLRTYSWWFAPVLGRRGGLTDAELWKKPVQMLRNHFRTFSNGCGGEVLIDP